MIAIGETLISEDILKEVFTCDLNRCLGACCVEGDSGAPLEEDELKVLDSIYEKVKPFMTEDGIRAVEKYGRYVYDKDDKEFVTPLILRTKAEKDKLRQGDAFERKRAEKKECAYTYFKNGVAGCAIEKANREGKISFKKPVSCHLYPVRISKHKGYLAVNYNQWGVCAPACTMGKQTKLTILDFCEEALTRRFGTDWVSALREAKNRLFGKPSKETKG